jgi:hypothetical protein
MIAVYISPESLTVEQYTTIGERLDVSGAPETGRTHHSCFGEDGHLMVFDIWDTQEHYDAFAGHLRPILADLGISGAEPDVLPVINVIQ